MKKVNVQIIRIISMILILVCHFLEESNYGILKNLAQFFNVGVFLFFLISGYVYSNKKIDNGKSFLVDRAIKVLVPMYIFLIPLFIVTIINHTFDFKYLFIYLFDIQWFFGSINGAAHLWFLTLIFICYITMIFVKKIENKFSIEKILLVLFVVGIFSAFVVQKISLLCFYLLTFYLGYFIGRKKQIADIKYIYSCTLIILSLILRLVTRTFLDDTILYNVIFSSLFHCCLAVGMFLFLYKFFINIKSTSLINYLDKISFPIYIVHYSLIRGPVFVYKIINNYWLATIVVLILSLVLSIILDKIVLFVSMFLKRGVCHEK